jgi:uncharacterized lipoprotein YehR (DUF1307 family)
MDIKRILLRLILMFAMLLVLSFLCQSQNRETSNRFQVDFNPEQGTFLFHDSENRYIFDGLSSVIHTSKGSFSTSENDFVWEKPARQKFTDSLGTGTSIVVNGFSRKIKMGVNYHINIYDSFQGITVEVSFTNRSSADLKVYSTVPIHLTGKDPGSMTSENFTKALLNGAM